MDPSFTFEVVVATGHPAFEGHFPGRPLMPGVALLAEAMEAALGEPALAQAIGATPRLSAVKFLAPVLPGARLELVLTLAQRGVSFTLGEGAHVAASGQFQRVDLVAAAP